MPNTGGYPGVDAELAAANLSVLVMIPFNDDPFGVIMIPEEIKGHVVAEDTTAEDDTANIISLNILRLQGTYGEVCVAWEIFSGDFPNGLPPIMDLILLASFPQSVVVNPNGRVPYAGTDVMEFPGLHGGFGTIDASRQLLDMPSNLDNFTISAWLLPQPNAEGFAFSKGDGNGTLYYGLKIHANESLVSMMLFYMPVGLNQSQVASASMNKSMGDKEWIQIVVIVENGTIHFFLDGELMADGTKSLEGEAIINRMLSNIFF